MAAAFRVAQSLGYAKLPNLDEPKVLADAGVIPAGARAVVAVIEGGTVRYTDDGTDPLGAAQAGGPRGAILPDAERFEYRGDLTKLRLAPNSGTPIVHLYYQP